MNKEHIKMSPTGRCAHVDPILGEAGVDFVEVYGTITEADGTVNDATVSTIIVADSLMVLLPLSLDELKGIQITLN